MVPSIICMWDGSNSHSIGVVLIETCRYHPLLQTLIQAKHFLLVQPSVSLISNLFNLCFEYPRKSASLLSSAVNWCFFYTLDMNLTQLLLLSLWKIFSKDFPYLFVRRRATTTQLFFCFSITFFQCGIFNFWILPSLLRHSHFKGFFDICKWSKNACPTFLKKICILRVWM